MKIKVLNTQTQVEIREMNLSDSIDRSGECLFGSLSHSGLVLDSPDVSRLHAKFSVEDGQYYFYDLGSANGSLVNGKIIQPNQGYLLKSGDIIRLGEFVLILQAVSEQPEELAATIVGDPNATVIGLQPDINWFSHQEAALSTASQQSENQISEVEKMALIEDLAAQEEDEDLFAESSLSESEHDLATVEKPFAQSEAIEPAELNELEALADSELERLEQELVEVEQQEAKLIEQEIELIEQEAAQVEAETESDETESDETESDEAIESLWAENSLTETIDEPLSSESVGILSRTEYNSDLEINKTQFDEQNSELDLAESIDLVSDPTSDPTSDPISDLVSDQEISEAEEYEPDSFSEPTLIQLDESENKPLSQSSEWIDSESNSTEIDTVESPDPQILEESGDLKLLESEFPLESILTQTGETADETVEAADESAHSSDGTVMQSLESIEAEPAEAIERPEAAAIEEFEMPEDDQTASSSKASIEPVVEDIHSIDETENLDEVTGLSVEDEITGLSAEEIEALDPVATLEQTITESVEAMPLETIAPVEPGAAKPDPVKTDPVKTDPVKTDVAVVLESQTPELTEASATYPDKYIALLAHDNQKLELIDFVAQHKDLLSHCLTIATHSVSDLLKRDLGFEVNQRTPTIPPDGYQTINSLITSDKILAVIFLRDFFTPQTTQANDEAFSRSCNIRQVMFASNLPTAEAIIHAIQATVVIP